MRIALPVKLRKGPGIHAAAPSKGRLCGHTQVGCFMNTSPFTGQNQLQCNQVIIMASADSSHFSLKQLAISEKRTFLSSDIFQAWADACP